MELSLFQKRNFLHKKNDNLNTLNRKLKAHSGLTITWYIMLLSSEILYVYQFEKYCPFLMTVSALVHSYLCVVKCVIFFQLQLLLHKKLLLLYNVHSKKRIHTIQ